MFLVLSLQKVMGVCVFFVVDFFYTITSYGIIIPALRLKKHLIPFIFRENITYLIEKTQIFLSIRIVKMIATLWKKNAKCVMTRSVVERAMCTIHYHISLYKTYTASAHNVFSGSQIDLSYFSPFPVLCQRFSSSLRITLLIHLL